METRLAKQEALTERALKRIEHLENLFATSNRSYPISTAKNVSALTPIGRAFDSSFQSPPSRMVPLLQSSNLFNTVEVDDNCYDKYQDPPPLPDPVIPSNIFLATPANTYYMESSDTYQPQHNITRPPRLPMSYHQGLPPTHFNEPQVITPQCLPIQGRRSKNKNESLPLID